MYYLRARYYDAETGRFISRDPIGQVDDVNLYSYVENNPVMYTDPSGEVKQAIIGGYDFITKITGLKTLGEGLGYSAVFWQGYLTGDDTLKNSGIEGLESIKTDVYWTSAGYATFGVLKYGKNLKNLGNAKFVNSNKGFIDFGAIVSSKTKGSVKNIKKIGDSYLKKSGINAHEIKRSILGKRASISKYDLYKDTKTGEIMLYRKGGVGKGIPTGEFIK